MFRNISPRRKKVNIQKTETYNAAQGQVRLCALHRAFVYVVSDWGHSRQAPTHLPFVHTCLSLVHGIFLFVVILEECAWVQHPLGKRPEPFVQVGEGHALVVKDLLEVRDRRARIVFCKKKPEQLGLILVFSSWGFRFCFEKRVLFPFWGFF